MSYATLTVSPVTPAMGGVVSGIDLTAPLSAAQEEDLRAALADRLVIFFRDQPLDHEAHKRLARVFGEIHIAPATKQWQVPGHPEVTSIHADANSTFVAGENWHSDMSCDPAPPLGSALYLHTVPPTGGDTAFADMYAAYEALSPRLKTMLEGLSAVHDARLAFGDITGEGVVLPKSVHPVVRTHPVTGRKALYVNREFTTHIEGIPKLESAMLLAFLFAHVQQPMFQCRFSWAPHSIALWDNRCTQHSAIWDYFPQVRSGYRVQIAGDVPR